MTSPLAAAVDALRSALPTSRHAETWFGLLVDLLGDQGVLATANEGRLRTLFRRDPLDPTLVVPWPLAQCSQGGRVGWVSPTIDTRTGEVVPDPEPSPPPPSRRRGLGPAEMGIFDGAAYLRLVFGDAGRFLEASVHDLAPGRLPELALASVSRRAAPVESIAACVALLDPSVHGPGRVHLPVPVPGGPEGSWHVGLSAVRRALFAGRIPDDARWVVADGVGGTAMGWGGTPAAARAAFEGAVEACPPVPDRTRRTAWDDYDDDGRFLGRGERPDPPAEGPWASAGSSPFAPAPGRIDLGGGAVRLRGPTPDVPLPPMTLANVPRVIVPLAASPPFAAPLGRWERTVGARGATAHVARLLRPGGFLQVGERVLWRVDPLTLDGVLDEVDARTAEQDAALDEAYPYRAFVRFASRTYRWAEARTSRPAGFERAGGSRGPHHDGADLDGDQEAVTVRRHVSIPRRR